MPIYYNQGAPTNTSKNTINSIMSTLPNIRDFLLLKNLTPKYPQKLGMLPSPKIGEPVLDTMVGNGSNLIPIGLPLETEGVLWKEQNVLPNTFKNLSTTANDLKSIDYIQDIPYISPNGLVSFGDSEWPNGIQSYPTGANDEITKYGIYGKTVNAKFKNDNTKKNLYLDVDKQIDMASFVSLQPVDTTQQIKGYVDQYGGLNLGGSGAVQAANIIGSITSGQGLGLSKGGVVPNFDVRSSLAGRVLGAAGLIKDTKLGQIGGQQLALALANNAAFNLQQDILGALNIQDNVLSLVKGQGFAAFPRPSYDITIPGSTGGRIADYTSKVLGFTIPRSYMTDEGSIFQSESGEVTNIDRANELLKTTGKGQLQALLANMNANINGTAADGIKDSPKYSTFRSGYAPGYKTSNKGKNEDTLTANMYAFQKGNSMVNLFSKEDGIIPDLSYLREERVSGYGFKSPEEDGTGPVGNYGYDDRKISDVGFTWTSNPTSKTVNARADYDEIIGDKKSLLVKTQSLFNSVGMLNIVSRKGDMFKTSSQIQQANGGGFSKGNAVLKPSLFGKDGRVNASADNAEDTYCRAWTTLSRYDSIAGDALRSGLVRNDGLYTSDSGKLPFRFNTENSVLEDTGFVHIAPYTNDFLSADVPRNVKNYMLSIENLAWFDRKDMLPKGELGPGDPMTGKQGRIMWFPPYDIQISESTSIDWEAHKFIGRGENMYTYNNTERSGQLSFKIIVDHSTYTNTFRGDTGPDDHYVASFMAGCIEPDSVWTDKFTSSQMSKIVPRITKIPQEKVAPAEEIPPTDIFVFFPNDQANMPITYEVGVSGTTGGEPDITKPIDYDVYLSPDYTGPDYGLGSYPSDFTYKTACANNNGVHKEWPDRHNYGLNYNGPYTQITKIGEEEFKGYFADGLFPSLFEYLNEKCPHCIIEVSGFASPQGRAECNQQLADARADAVVKKLKDQFTTFGWTPEKVNSTILKKKSFQIPQSESKCKVCPSSVSEKDRAIQCPPDTFGCKFDRRVRIHFEYDPLLASADIAEPKECIETAEIEVNTKITEKFYNETMFFDKLKKTDKFIFDRFRDKIKYFHPAFHSTTPEGLNSRLTFLQQCTRQGPTDTHTTNNLAFGRAPICILRVGDFYNTKIIIDSLNIDYEPLVWDLNPEGIGVQPMIANVSLSFKFIGAESLYGPINKLQNALSFNYYANTHVYEARADFLSQAAQPATKDVGPDGEEVTLNSNELKTGLFLNDGRYTVNPEVGDSYEVEKSKINSCDEDQIKANEKPASVQETPISNSGSIEPKITSILSISIIASPNLYGVGNDLTDRGITVSLNSEGIQTMNDDGTFNKLITDDELKTFLSKGLKIIVEKTPTPSNTSRVEELISFDTKDILGKNPWELFGGVYFLGTKSRPDEYASVTTMPDEGNYSITIIYDGKTIQSIMAIASNTKDFESRS